MEDSKLKVYLAGQWNEYENNWKEGFKKLDSFEFFDPEVHADQTSADTYFPQDLTGIKNADILVAHPGVVVSEATWIEIGYFYALNTKKPGDFCEKLIIVWKPEREPKWALDFVKKTGFVVDSVEKAKQKLESFLQ